MEARAGFSGSKGGKETKETGFGLRGIQVNRPSVSAMSLAFLFCLPLILTRSFYYLSLFLFIAQPPKDDSTAQAYYAALAGGRDEAGGEPPDAPPFGEDAVPPSPRADTDVTAPTLPEASRRRQRCFPMSASWTRSLRAPRPSGAGRRPGARTTGAGRRAGGAMRREPGLSDMPQVLLSLDVR